MGYTIPLTGAQVEKTILGRLYSPVQDVVGDNYTVGSPLIMSGGSPYRFVCNGNIRNYKNFPPHITNMWDTVNNKIVVSEFQDTPEIVANVQFIFKPSVSAAGSLTMKMYVDETTPRLMKTYTVPYKATVENVTILSTFYAGSEAGFDVKNKGVFFEITPSGNGDFYNPAIEPYRT